MRHVRPGRLQSVGRPVRDLSPIGDKADYSQFTYQELIEALIWHYDQFQNLWRCVLGLDPPDWQTLEQISGDLSELEQKLLHVGVLL